MTEKIFRFTQRTPLRMHVRRHNNELPFECSWGCGKRFVSNAVKNAHELSKHLGEKRFYFFIVFGQIFPKFSKLNVEFCDYD